MDYINPNTKSRNLSETAMCLANVIGAEERRGEHLAVLDGVRSRLRSLSKLNGDPRLSPFHSEGASNG